MSQLLQVVVPLAAVLAAGTAAAASASGTSGFCSPDTQPALRFVGLPTSVPYGPPTHFVIEEDFHSGATTDGPVELEVLDEPTGTVLSRRRFRGPEAAPSLQLTLGQPPVRVRARFVERPVEGGAACSRVIETRVAGYVRLYIQTACGPLVHRPRRLALACGDQKVVLSRLIWTDLDSPRASATGVWSDSSRAGRRARVRVAVSGLRRCRDTGRYHYRRLIVRRVTDGTGSRGRARRWTLRCHARGQGPISPTRLGVHGD